MLTSDAAQAFQTRQNLCDLGSHQKLQIDRKTFDKAQDHALERVSYDDKVVDANKVAAPEIPSLAMQLRDFSKFNRKLPPPVPWDR